jgi:hypothetical protein
MKTSIKAALVAFALATGSLAIAPAIAADVTVGVGPGGIAFGYKDGYWDQGHKWHAWASADEAAHWRAANKAHYYEWKHDRDKGEGWRETDRYWEHR